MHGGCALHDPACRRSIAQVNAHLILSEAVRQRAWSRECNARSRRRGACAASRLARERRRIRGFQGGSRPLGGEREGRSPLATPPTAQVVLVWNSAPQAARPLGGEREGRSPLATPPTAQVVRAWGSARGRPTPLDVASALRCYSLVVRLRHHCDTISEELAAPHGPASVAPQPVGGNVMGCEQTIGEGRLCATTSQTSRSRTTWSI